MIVSLQLQAAIAQRAGVGRYVHTLAPLLSELRGEDTLLGFYFDFRRKGTPFPPGILEERAVRWVPGALVQQAWKRIGFPPYTWFAPKADVHHFPNFVIPPLPKGPKAVVNIHDASFLRFPETLEPKNLAYLRSRMDDTVKRANKILTISDTIADELREAYRLPADKLRTTLLGPPPSLAENITEAEASAVMRELGQDRPFLLHVGTLEPRKNHAFLFKVFEQLDQFDGDLVLCGMEGWHVGPILAALAQNKRRDRIRRLHYLSDTQLAALYRKAEALLFPSLYEGYGLPPVEAMRQGCPVISSDGGSLPEIVGKGGIVLPLALDAWVEAVHALLSDASERTKRVEAGYRRASQFSWKKCAEETWEVYREVGG